MARGVLGFGNLEFGGLGLRVLGFGNLEFGGLGFEGFGTLLFTHPSLCLSAPFELARAAAANQPL